MRCFLVVFVALSLALSVPASAQFANADLMGTVSDADGRPLPGVTVTVRSEAQGLSRTTVTAANGVYALNGLKPGAYTLTFVLDGFRTVSRSGLVLRVGQESRLSVELQIGSVEETISVIAEAPLLETTSKEIGGTLSAQEFESLPTQNRSALLFASLLPGVIPSPSTASTASDALFINGQDDNSNSFNIDGANNDDDVIGARAGAQARTPMEAIQEFQVLTTQFDAEFGRSLGGVLNAITKSGGNEFQGALFSYFQRADWDEKNFFTERAGLDQPDAEYRSVGFIFGGPIVRNRAHFFISREDNLDEEGISRTFLTRPDLNFTTTEDNDIENTLVKVDYQPFTDHHISIRYLLEESPQFDQIIGNITQDASREEDDTDSNWTFAVESVVTDRAFNVGRVSFTKEDVSFANPGFNNNGQNFAAQRSQAPSEVHPGFTSGASTVAQSRVNRALQVDDTFSIYLPEWHGEHELRAGFQWSRREEEFTNFGTLNGQFFNFDADLPFDPSDISTYPGSFRLRVLGGQTAAIPNNETLGIFVQDDWRVGSHLTLNLGLRFDSEDITNDDNISPRIGFSWDPRGTGRTVVRGGYGRFYDRFQMGFFQNFFLDAVNVAQGFLLRVPDVGQNQQFFFDLAQANGITNLTQLRDLLAAQLEGGASGRLNAFPTVDNPSRRQPYSDTFSLGVEHEVWPGVAAGVDLIRTQSRDVLLSVDLNPTSAAAGGRPNISVVNGQPVELGSITTWVNGGENDYTALQLSLRKRFTGRFGGRASYTWADSEGNHEGGGGGTAGAYFQTRTQSGYDFDRGVPIGAPLDLNLDDPRTKDLPVRWYREHNLVVSGSYRVPQTSWRDNGGLIVSGLFRYLSGDQITLLENSARLDNGNRAPLAGGTFDPTTPSDIGEFGTRFDGTLRGAENPDFLRLDLSLRYRVPLGERFTVALLGDLFNVTDEVNFASLGGTRFATGTFLTPNRAFNPRQVQLGLRLEF